LPRVDDYKTAFEIAAKKLRGLDPEKVAELSGAKLAGNALRLRFVDQDCAVHLDPVSVEETSGGEVALTDQVLILHYLIQGDGRLPSGEWIAYREVPGAQTYQPVFYKRAIAPLKEAFGQRPELLTSLTEHLAPAPGQGGDASVIIPAFPRTPVMLIVWNGDDEFPPEANILFDKSITGYLTAEDIAWLAGRIVYFLAGMARKTGAAHEAGSER